MLSGASPGGGWRAVAGTLAVVLASVSYAVSSLYGQHLIGETTGPLLSTTALLGAVALLLPFGIAQAPSQFPSLKAVACVVALALFGTAFAQILWFRMLRRYGSASNTMS